MTAPGEPRHAARPRSTTYDTMGSWERPKEVQISHAPQKTLVNAQGVPADVGDRMRHKAHEEGDQPLLVLIPRLRRVRLADVVGCCVLERNPVRIFGLQWSTANMDTSYARSSEAE